MKIFANHAHVFPASLRPQGTIDGLLTMLDGCGIEKAVCFAPFPHELKDHNAWLAGELKGRDRLVGFGTLDLRRDDQRDQVKWIVDLGLRGLKLHPNVQEFDLLSREALLAYEAAQEAGLFISFHSGVHHYRIEHYKVLKFDEIAWRFPDLRFSMEHVGGWAFFHEAVAVICNNIPFPAVPGRKCRVYGGLTSVFTPNYIRMWYMPPERMMELIRQVGAEQLIFGLDFPYNLEENTKMGLKAINELPVSEEERAAILGGNLGQLIGMHRN
jgi:predicted TIM-barrel fold metal-dependent hydrolase